MAFEKYEVSRSNIYNSDTCDIASTDDIDNAMSVLNAFKSENKAGDVLMIFWIDTEDGGYLEYSMFNSPYDGWVCNYNRIDEMER